MKSSLIITGIIFLLLSCGHVNGDSFSCLRKNYLKQEIKIKMRDGVRLFTSIYCPKDNREAHPILLWRTPYGVGPYGKDFRHDTDDLIPYLKEGYILVFQDVRGKFMSQGKFEDVRAVKDSYRDSLDTDETTDAYDSVDWLVKNLKQNNGRVGLIGISYPGFYAAMGGIRNHQAVKAVSPQAPVSDWWVGDDYHRNGAFSLASSFSFLSSFGQRRDSLTTRWPEGLEIDDPDGYSFFKKAGPVSGFNKRYYKGKVAFIDSITSHPDYDSFWQSRSTARHLKGIKCAVLNVGGWFDAEDFYGTLCTYSAIEKENPGIFNKIIIGPWSHGGWKASKGDSLGMIGFGSKTAQFFRDSVQFPFFNFFLKGKGKCDIAEARVFETGSNSWRSYNVWPPEDSRKESLYLGLDGSLSCTEPKVSTEMNHPDFSSYSSDPEKPVPFTEDLTQEFKKEYMVEDQRFASKRPDVLSFETEPLKEDRRFSGPVRVRLFVSANSTDADLYVKLIDCFPVSKDSKNLSGYQMLLRWNGLRGRYRKSPENPEALNPGKIEEFSFMLDDINHCFKKGHRIMVQVQSSLFPLVDRNPQQFINIYKAEEKDYRKADIKVFFSKKYPSSIELLRRL